MARGLQILFCGINPGLYSAAIGHHFGRPGNRFWPALHQAGFSDRLLTGYDDRLLLKWNYGVTNLVARATATADELTVEEFRAGRKTLLRKVKRYQPKVVAVLGIGAFRTAFELPKAVLGLQPDLIENTIFWVLPNPSGLNAHYQLADLVREFRALRESRSAQSISVVNENTGG